MADFWDILVDENYDLRIENGDFVTGPSDQQHVQHILVADKGHYRQWPLLGFGILRYSKASIDPQAVKKQIDLQLRQDNYRVRQIIVTSDYEISIDAKRIR